MEEQSNNRIILCSDVLNYLGEQRILNSDHRTRKKALVDRQEHQSREQLVKRSQLQLIGCALVSSHGVGHVFWNDRSHQDKGFKWASGGVGGDKIILGLVDVNLQTKELHCNYSVLIGSLEQEESSLLCYPTIITFRRIIRRIKLHNYHISGI